MYEGALKIVMDTIRLELKSKYSNLSQSDMPFTVLDVALYYEDGSIHLKNEELIL